VKKFGGTSLATTQRIDFIAGKIASEKKESERVVVIVSAMGNHTDELIKLALEINPVPCQRELDMLLTAGERISMSLLSIALQKYGIDAISFTGSQSGIITNCSHGNARIVDVNAFRIREELNRNKVVIVAGFQGVSPQKEVTTLGRGGSDTSAVAIASYLNADKCEIYTDVEGVFTADPRIVSSARKMRELDYEQTLTLAFCGANVLQPRSVEFAMEYNVPVEVKSSFSFKEGTIIKENVELEKQTVTSVTGNKDLYEISFKADNLLPIWEEMATRDLVIDHFFQRDGFLVLVIEKGFLTCLMEVLSKNSVKFNLLEIASIVPVGFRLDYDNELIFRIISDLKSNGISVYAFTRVNHGIKIYLQREYFESAIKLIHKDFIE